MAEIIGFGVGTDNCYLYFENRPSSRIILEAIGSGNQGLATLLAVARLVSVEMPFIAHFSSASGQYVLDW